MVEISEKKREYYNTLRNKELKAVYMLDPGFSCEGLVGEFFGLYFRSEVYAKKLQHYYRVDTSKSGKDELNIKTLKAALKHFKLIMSETDLKCLFRGGTGKRGSKSARQLRNGYLHDLSPEDRKEIMLKAQVLIPKMEKFLSMKLI